MTVYTAENGLLGGTGDILLEIGTENRNSGSWEPSAPQCSVGVIGGPAVRFDFTVAGADAHIATGMVFETIIANGRVVYLDVFGQTLGQETSLLSDPGAGYRPLRLRPDGRLAVYDVNGNLLGLSTSSAAGVWRKVVLVEDGTGAYRTVHLFVDGVEELAVVSSTAVLHALESTRDQYRWGWGDKLVAGQSTGTVYYLRNALLRFFTQESESPRLVRWPALQVAPRRIPTAEGDLAQWNNGTTPSPNTWQDVDEFPNDGDTTRIADAQSPPGERHYFRSGALNPLPAGASILGVQLYCSGRVFGSGKFLGYLSVRAGGQNADSLNLSPTTAWRGFAWLFTARPDGTPWTREDFDPGVFQFGLRSDFLADPPGSACSNICYQVVYWTDLLPLATTPSPPSAGRAQVLIV